MPFDQPTRNLLARFVGDARALLTEEFTRQLQQEYGLDPERGDVTDLSRLGHLDDARRATALLLRETLAYYLAGQPKPDAKARREALDRIVREQAFTILNRLCALRMAEGRGLLIESVGRDHRSQGFQLYVHLAGTGLGESGDAYRCYLFSLFDELALELPVLFDRWAPEGRLFPRETALLDVLALINAPEIAPLWAEDETIGWIYQYFNSVEERRQMRAESQAPRNSRELAVRNQFFTPRYVVEFLTDNTLGRIWYEMTKGETSLTETCRYLVRRPTEIFLAEGEEAPQQNQPAEDVSQDELLRQPVYIPYRPLKDPRDILMLDPACGSLHFGLYAFDLYERIYDEAWELEGVLGFAAFIRSDGLLPLRDSYPDKTAFLADVPRLIIERNIHGIDIDPRAVQIAGLSLWLRAQRSWQAQGVKPQDRPQIRRSNIVCAEPMPGDRALLEEFLKTLRDERLEGLIRRVWKTPATQRVRATPSMADALCDLVRTVWKEMELAGEAGSLLKIEETLADAVARGKAEWDEKMPLFRVAEFGLSEQDDAKPTIRYYKTIPGENADFWDRAEVLVLAALQDYSERAENGEGYRRRLFAGDAARGFAFIDLCHKRYDVVLMNPPFGVATSAVFRVLKTSMPSTYTELYASFVKRGLEIASPGGRVGAITSRAFLYISRLEALRREDLEAHIDVLLDFGANVMDAAFVEACAYTIGKSYAARTLIAFDARRCEARHDLGSAIGQILPPRDVSLYVVPWVRLSLLPSGKFLYYLPSAISTLLYSHLVFEPSIGTVRQGMGTFDDFRFVHLLWEVPRDRIGEGRVWEPLAKGGPFAKYYGQIHLAVNWWKDGGELCEVNISRNGQTAQVRQASDYWRLGGCTYSKRSVKGFSARALPQGCIMAGKGPAIISQSDISNHYLLGWLNSRLITGLIQLQANASEFNTGILKKLPWVEPDRSTSDMVSKLAHTTSLDVRSQHRWDETDEYFAFLPVCEGMLAQQIEEVSGHRNSKSAEVIKNDAAITQMIDSLYGVDSSLLSTAPDETLADDEDEDSDTHSTDTAREYTEHLISGGLGLVFGRWDIRFATGEKPAPALPDPFAPLPSCPPGMLQNVDSLPAVPEDVLVEYPLSISWSGILVDSEDNSEDIERRVRGALHLIWGERTDAVEAEACQILGVRTLREYFRKPALFFADHLKRYSKSRRQAPIYWPLSTPSGSYTLWLYYHRLSDQTLYTCVNDFVDPKLKQVSDDAGRLRQKRGRSSADEKELEQLAGLELELTDFRAELLRIAAFWKPNLNDGVQITAAPLWRLFQHRPWQKMLKETWEKLEAGEYDWAHLAMSIWPERVVPKCVTDRSLAIAHDVEDLFWVEDGGRWRNLNPPEEELAEQVRREQRPGRDQLRSGLAALTLGEGRGLRCEQVYEALATGKWDDLMPALLLWPERVAQKCWDDPLLAVTLKIDLPTKRTKTARERFIAERMAAGCPDLADALREALADRVDRFASLWAELARGDRDELALALALWPGRVVDKCAKDVELAERHGLQRFLWVQDLSGVWRRRKKSNEEIRDAVIRRGSRI